MESQDPQKMMAGGKLYIIAGEASGDLHGKNLVRALKREAPDLELRGFGGDGMQAEGVTLTRHFQGYDFMGWQEILKNLGKIMGLFRDVKRDIAEFKPDTVLLIDYPGFNLRMAKWCKKRGIKVLYYISPQVWAWKKGRVRKIRAYVDRMFVILPFEKTFYEKEGVDVDFVGHPLLDEIENFRNSPKDLRSELGLDDRPIIALLPGSRKKQEIGLTLPVMLQVVERFPDHQFVIAGAPGIPMEFYEDFTFGFPVKVLHRKTYAILSLAEFALVTSGTATLETALFEVPQVTCYSGPSLSIWLARRLVRVNFISLVNLILEKRVITELIHSDMTAQNFSAEMKKVMEEGKARSKMLADYTELRNKLGPVGASDRVAALVLKYM